MTIIINKKYDMNTSSTHSNPTNCRRADSPPFPFKRATEVRSMKAMNTQRTTTHLRTALLAALVLGMPVLAAARDSDAALAHNERAAQSAIVSADIVGNALPAHSRVA